MSVIKLQTLLQSWKLLVMNILKVVFMLVTIIGKIEDFTLVS